jgi:DNA-binding response OmpR family regulator
MPDVILLDVRMPQLSGFEVLRSIRKESETPVIFVSARDDEDDIVHGLRLGADDYVIKPFSPRQLVARIHSVTRRMGLGAPSTETRLEAAGLMLDLESHEVSRDGRAMRMTPIEFRLLRTLMASVGRVVSSSRLIEEAWGAEGGDTTMLKSHICHIRKKLKLRDGAPGYIRSTVGLGYTLER